MGFFFFPCKIASEASLENFAFFTLRKVHFLYEKYFFLKKNRFFERLNFKIFLVFGCHFFSSPIFLVFVVTFFFYRFGGESEKEVEMAVLASLSIPFFSLVLSVAMRKHVKIRRFAQNVSSRKIRGFLKFPEILDF